MNKGSIEATVGPSETAVSALLGAPSVPARRGRPADGDTLLSDPNILTMFGGISRMTLWRWRQDLGFPEADHEIHGRRYTWKSQVLAWLAEQPKPAPTRAESSHEHCAAA